MLISYGRGVDSVDGEGGTVKKKVCLSAPSSHPSGVILNQCSPTVKSSNISGLSPTHSVRERDDIISVYSKIPLIQTPMIKF